MGWGDPRFVDGLTSPVAWGQPFRVPGAQGHWLCLWRPARVCAALSRPLPQMTYSLTRFAIYETVRDRLTKGSQGPLPFSSKVLLGGVSGEHALVGWGWPGGHLQAPRGMALWFCRPRSDRRLCGNTCGLGQRQVCVPLSLRPRTFLSPDSPGLSPVACWGPLLTLEQATQTLESGDWVGAGTPWASPGPRTHAQQLARLPFQDAE